MHNFSRYLHYRAKKVAEICEKPLTLLATMAFLFAGMVLLPIANFPVVENLLINTAIATMTLLLVLILVTTHGRDIRALQARVDEFATELENVSLKNGTDQLSPMEVGRIRALLTEQTNGLGEDARRVNRDKRPSLF